MPQNMPHASLHCASARSENGAPDCQSVQGHVRPESPVMAPNVTAPRTVLVHCTIARSENGAPVQGNVWLEMHWILRTPMLCVKPLNDPIEAIFLKTFETPERDASGCGWRLGFKTKVHCKEGALMSELIRLYPTTPQTSDQQLDDVIAAIRGFATQVLAKADFQHLMASPDEMSRLALPTFPTQSSVQPPVLAICSPLPVCTQESTVPQTEYFAVPDDEFLPVCPLWQLNNPECVASRITVRDWRVLESAWYRWLNFYRDRWQRSPYSSEVEDSSDSDSSSWFFMCDLPRSSTQDFRLSRNRRVLGQAWLHWLQYVETRRYYSDSFSDCSSFDDDYEDYIEWPSAPDSLPRNYTRNPWRSDCHITCAEADYDGTWELPSLTAADCAGELEMIRYAVCLSTMAFEESAAAAVSQERYATLAGYLERAGFASHMASVKDYCENKRDQLRRRHTMRTPPAKFSTKRGRRQHQQELRRARARRKSDPIKILRLAQSVPQFRSAFVFAPPTAPTIPLTTTRDVFIFGATVTSLGIDSSLASSSATLLPPPLSSTTSSSPESSFSSSLFRTMERRPQRNRSLHRSASLSLDPRSHGRGKCDRPKVTTQSDRSEPREIFTVPVHVPLALDSFPMDEGLVENSDQASAASTAPLLVTLLCLLRGLRPVLPRHRRRKVRDFKSNWQRSHSSTTDTDFGKHLWQPQALFSRCTRAHIKALGRSRWLNGLCRCLHSGCTDGTGPRPSLEP